MTTLEHKVRNPKKLDTWLDIWTANNITVNNDNTVNYTITPSNKWKIPITQLTLNNGNKLLDDGENIVTTTNDPENTTSGLAYFNSYNEVKAINADRGLSLETKNNKTTIGHVNSSINGATIGPTSSNEPPDSTTEGASVYIPSFTYDSYGHITGGSNITYTVKNLTINNLSENGFTPAEGEGQNAIPGKSFNKTVVDIISSSINNLPINSASSNGIVKAVQNEEEKNPNDFNDSSWKHADEIWASNSESIPAWRKITANMFDENTKISADNLPKNWDGEAGIIDEAPKKINSNVIKPNMVWGTDSYEDENDKPGWMSLINTNITITIHYDEENKTLSVGNSTNPWEKYSVANSYDSTKTYYIENTSENPAEPYISTNIENEAAFNSYEGNLYYRDYNWSFILSKDSKVELREATS